MNNSTDLEKDKKLINYMVQEMSNADTPQIKDLKKKAEIVLKYKNSKLEWMRKEDKINGYISLSSNLIDYCRKSCLYTKESINEIDEKKCLTNCTGKYYENIKLFNINFDYYKQEFNLNGLWFNIPEHIDGLNNIKKSFSIK